MAAHESSDHRHLRLCRQLAGRGLLERRDRDLDIVGIDNLMRPGSEMNRARLRELGVTFVHGDIRAASDFGIAAGGGLGDRRRGQSERARGRSDRLQQPAIVRAQSGQRRQRARILQAHKAGLLLLSTSRVYSIPALAVAAAAVGGTMPFVWMKPPSSPPGFPAVASASTSPLALRFRCTAAPSWRPKRWRSNMARRSISGLDQPLRRAGRGGAVRHAGSGRSSRTGSMPTRAAARCATSASMAPANRCATCFIRATSPSLVDAQMNCTAVRRPAHLYRGRRPGERHVAGAADRLVRRALRPARPALADPRPRPYDIPWVVMDIARRRERFRLARRIPARKHSGRDRRTRRAQSGLAGDERPMKPPVTGTARNPFVCSRSSSRRATKKAASAPPSSICTSSCGLHGIEHEIVVVDDGSTDCTWDTARKPRTARAHPDAGAEYRRARLRPSGHLRPRSRPRRRRGDHDGRRIRRLPRCGPLLGSAERRLGRRLRLALRPGRRSDRLSAAQAGAQSRWPTCFCGSFSTFRSTTSPTPSRRTVER